MKKSISSVGRAAALFLAFGMIISMVRPELYAVYASENDAETFVFSGTAADDEKEPETDGKDTGTEPALTEQSVKASISAGPVMQNGLVVLGRKAMSLRPSGKGIGPEIVLSGLLPEGAVVNVSPVSVDIPGQTVLAAYDITISVPETDENGEATGEMTEWQPQPDESLNVSIRDASLVNAADVEIYHLEDTSAEPESIDITTAYNGAVSFDAESFSIYAIVETVLEKTIAATDGNTYRITASYDSTSGIPTSGTALLVSEIAEESEEYGEYLAQAGDMLSDDSRIRMFDISIVDENDETVVYQPAEGTAVDVKIELINTNYRAGSEASIVHIGEDGTEVLPAAVEPKEESCGYEFSTGSFSAFIVSYTVDFWYEGYRYSNNGEDSVLLSELFERLPAYSRDYYYKDGHET